jgi:hypothetical protein
MFEVDHGVHRIVVREAKTVDNGVNLFHNLEGADRSLDKFDPKSASVDKFH